MIGSCTEYVYSFRRKHVFNLHTETNSIKNGAKDKAITFLHIHRFKFLVTIRNISDERFHYFFNILYIPILHTHV